MRYKTAAFVAADELDLSPHATLSISIATIALRLEA
jgi:hypothetical protein